MDTQLTWLQSLFYAACEIAFTPLLWMMEILNRIVT
jgi:hypothetical protein